MSVRGRASVSPAPRILIVEDDRATREFYSETLTAAGFRIDQAHNGFQALEKAIDIRPDLILTDIALPGLDGIELCRRIRADPCISAIPLLAITGHGDRRYPDRARLAGADGVLTKPCAPELLVETARSLLDHRVV